jgi:hypothetical protein
MANTKFDRTSTGEPQMASRTEVSAVVTFLLISAPSQVKEKRRERGLRVVQNCSEAISGTYRFRFDDRFVRPPEYYLTIQIQEKIFS